MKIEEFLKDEKVPHSHCHHCPHIALFLPVNTASAGLNYHSGHFNDLNTVLHLMTVHPDIFAEDTELVEEVKEIYRLEL